jgi:hypothetical protein
MDAYIGGYMISKRNEAIAKEREDRYKLIQKASAGDEKARKLLEGPPYSMKVYTPEERKAYEESS